MSKGTMINWTPGKLARFKKTYERAKAADQGEFGFDGHEFVLGYAKYLIEYLEGLFNRPSEPDWYSPKSKI